MTYLTKKRDFAREKDMLYQDMRAYGYKSILEHLTPLTRAIKNHKEGGASTTQPTKARDICPLHNSKKGDKFTLNGNVSETGAGRCWKCGRIPFMDIILGFNPSWEYRDAMEQIKKLVYPSGAPRVFADGRVEYGDGSTTNVAELPPPQTYEPKIPELTPKEVEYAQKLRNRYDTLWNEAVSLNHPDADPARLYFLNRSIQNFGELGGDVRFHRGVKFTEVVEDLSPDEGLEEYQAWVEKMNFLRQHMFYQSHRKVEDKTYFDMGVHPCIMLMMRDTLTGESKSLHRIYLTPDGYKMELDGHYDIKIKKRMPGIPGTTSHGSACCIDVSHAGIIGIAEGLETTLAVRGQTTMPMHCGVDINGLRGYNPQDHIHTVVIWVDKDRSGAGELAAEETKERLEDEGFNVILAIPPLELDGAKSVDWQDVVAELGEEGIPLQLRNGHWQLISDTDFD